MISPGIISIFFAGMITFLAPCTLPLLPGYLAFISGISLQDAQNQDRARRARGRIFLNGALFVFGFSAVFVLMGTLVGLTGVTFLVPYRMWLGKIGGIFVILFGLHMLGVLHIPFLMREKKFTVPALFKPGKSINSFIFGSAFAVGWTPCVGPILGSILLVASTSATAVQGGVLLSVFSAGLAVPFLIISLALQSASRFIIRIAKYLPVVSVVGGLFLIFLGVLLLTDHMVFFISYSYYIFRFLNYDALLNYL